MKTIDNLPWPARYAIYVAMVAVLSVALEVAR